MSHSSPRTHLNMFTNYIVEALTTHQVWCVTCRRALDKGVSMTYLVGNENFGQIWILEVERNMWSGYKRAKKKSMIMVVSGMLSTEITHES